MKNAVRECAQAQMIFMHVRFFLCTWTMYPAAYLRAWASISVASSDSGAPSHYWAEVAVDKSCAEYFAAARAL